MFPLLGAEGCTQQQKIPAIPLYGFVNNSSEKLHEIQPECPRLYGNNNQMEVENKTSCWESETMNRHSVGPGGSEASDELSSRLFVLRRLMWIQMDRSREGTECASIFTRVCFSLPDTDMCGDTNSWMAGRFFTKTFTTSQLHLEQQYLQSLLWIEHVSGLRYEVSSCRPTPMQYKAPGRMIK